MDLTSHVLWILLFVISYNIVICVAVKSRYGDVALEDESSESESEDENAEAVTPALERGFFKTLACLKRKDPSIYDKTKLFYDEEKEKVICYCHFDCLYFYVHCLLCCL